MLCHKNIMWCNVSSYTLTNLPLLQFYTHLVEICKNHTFPVKKKTKPDSLSSFSTTGIGYFISLPVLAKNNIYLKFFFT